MPSRKRAESEELPEEEPPTDIDPYEILNLESEATADDIKKAYRKAALKHHPDKVPKDHAETAKVEFQRIAFAYGILSDPRRRSRYDTTGSTSEALLDSDDDFNWLDFFRAQYSSLVTEDKINSFKDTYKGSDEERGDLLQAYQKCQGNMNKIYNSVMLSNVLEDDERFRCIIDRAIESNEVPRYDAYMKETEKTKASRVKAAQRRAKEFDESQEADKAKGKAGAGKGTKAAKRESDLLAMIQSNKQKSSSFLDDLEAKYAQKEKPRGKKRKSEEDEPSEDAFKAMGERAKKSKGRK